ncbi:MAG: PP2C family protein-serine/threonine phosphatase [Verrucomicrobiales bacterium]
MWDLAAIFVLVVTVALLAMAWWRQRRRAHLALRAHAAHDAEEHRVFEFLHDLGATLEQISPRKLHQRIVRGVASVVQARGGALYLLDGRRDLLVPTFITPECPPLIELPPAMVEKLASDVQAVRSYVQLQSVPAPAGVLGQVLSSERPLNLRDLHDHPVFSSIPAVPGETVAALVSPLAYASKKLGVLAVARNRGQPSFSAREFELFKSMAEQSAFALGSAMVQQEVVEKRRIEDELRRASEIQRVLLPSQPPQVEGFTIAAAYQPAKVVSGDYYDFLQIDATHLGVVIADVSGKGIPAGLVMATCRGLLRVSAQSSLSPSEVLRGVNRMLFADIREDMFVSLAYCIFNTSTGEVTMSRAGHDPPFLFRRGDGSIEALKPPGLALGVDKGAVFDRTTRDFTFQLDPGDCLLFYTDGVTEAVDSSGMNEFGVERLRSAFAASAASASVENVLAEIQSRLGNFVHGAHPHDDITLVAVQRSIPPDMMPEKS